MTRQFSKVKPVIDERNRIVREFTEPLKAFLDSKPEGYTRMSVSEELGLQRNALYKLFTGKQCPTIDTLARISLFLKANNIQRGCV